MERTMCTLATETSVFVLVGLRLVYVVSANWENLQWSMNLCSCLHAFSVQANTKYEDERLAL